MRITTALIVLTLLIAATLSGGTTSTAVLEWKA